MPLSVFAMAFAVSASGCSCRSSSTGTACGPDDRERNDTPTTAFDLGEMTDDPDSKQNLSLSIDSDSDVDFFKFFVKDRGLGGDPVVTVNGPAGYEVTTWFTCATGNTLKHACSRGTVADEPGVITQKGCKSISPSASVVSSTDCSNTPDDDGQMLIRVRKLSPSGSCENYNLAIEVE